MERRVLVTGATGFIGPTVVRELVNAGYRVIALVRDDRAHARLERQSGLEFRQGDLRDRTSLMRAIRDCHAVIHLAALVDPKLLHDPSEVFAVNRDATIELARCAREAGVARFVFMSSIAAMGFRSGLATSESPCRPTTDYGRAKLEAEHALAALKTVAFQPIVLRPPTVYGPGERYNFLSLVRAIERGYFRIIGDGTNRFPLCTTENLARTVVAAVDGRLPDGVHLVADAEPYSFDRITRAVARALGRRVPKLHVPIRVARVVSGLNELVSAALPAVPLVLSRARVMTLTSDQPFDVAPLLRAGVPLDAPLERFVELTVDGYRLHRLL